ncbi:MAG: hypothetical protein II886_03905 [Prevotella sp.]|nr:hypothetical protein [Prevotella sp.]
MKSKNFILAAMLLAMPSTIMAQQNIQKAFDALLNDKITENKTRHVLDRDPETGRMTAMADVYDLTISSSSALERLNDIRKAFDKDKKNAYSVNSGIRQKDGEDAETDSFSSLFESMGLAPVTLFVGDGKHSSVSIGSMKGSDYIYACFADKDDPDKRYRYAYALEWVEKAKKTKVRLAVTYALRPESRDSKFKLKSIKINGNALNLEGISDLINDNINGLNDINIDSLISTRTKSPESWLSEFNTYKNLFLKKPDGNASSHYATYIYKLCKNAGMLDADEKKMVALEIAKLKTSTKDEFIKQLFDMSIKRLGN